MWIKLLFYHLYNVRNLRHVTSNLRQKFLAINIRYVHYFIIVQYWRKNHVRKCSLLWRRPSITEDSRACPNDVTPSDAYPGGKHSFSSRVSLATAVVVEDNSCQCLLSVIRYFKEPCDISFVKIILTIARNTMKIKDSPCLVLRFQPAPTWSRTGNKFKVI